ncbi:MlaD family protein [Actinocorallia libanotica]|uniref:Phospholipid/cholesterol/gamma-HCH transport system substrate-binding protein n=1 Tax=Actinocorallia libanotica TaxID=46162 RepID=A0ABP4C020_9ACTN
MRPRILINLISFALLGVALVVWALTSIVSVDALRKPFTVRAEFASSPGLRSDLEVSYLGVKVGSVDKVQQGTGMVLVDLHLDRGVVVPSNVKAAVLRKSAIGEPYIAMEPGDGETARPMREGDRIPLARTSVTVNYKELFDSVGGLLKAVDPKDANTVIHELALGLAGRDNTLRDMIGDANQLTGTLAENAEVLDELSVQLTALTKVLADGGPELANGLDGLAAFNGELAGRREDLDSVLDRGPQFMAQVKRLVEDARPGLSCLLNALGTPAPSLFTPQASKQLSQALGLLHKRFPKIVDNVIEKEPSGRPYIRVTMALTAAGPVPAAKEYRPPLTGIQTPDLYYCTKAYKSTDLEEKAEKSGTQVNEPQTTARSGPFTAVEAPTAQAEPVSQETALGRWLPVLPVVLAAAALALTARRTLAVVRRRARR